jgi:outer membrane lipoprotein SlyB
VALVALTLLAACGGGDGPTSPGGDGGDPIGQTPSALVFGLDSVRPSEFVTLRPKGLGRAVPDSVIGKIGTTEFRAVKLDDSTLVGIAPQGVTGTQTVTFVLDGRPFAGPLYLEAPIVIGDPTAAATKLFDRVLARYDSVEASLNAGNTNGVDSTAVRAFIDAGRSTVEAARTNFLALSDEERRAAMPYIAAEAAAVGLEIGATPTAIDSPFDIESGARMARTPLGSPALASPASPRMASVCSQLTSFDNCAKLSATRATIRAGALELVRCSVKSLSSSAVGGVVGGVLGAFLGGGAGSVPATVTGIKVGAAVGAGVGVAWCMSDVWDQVTSVYDNAVNPVVASVDEVFATTSRSMPGSSFAARSVAARYTADGATVFTSGVGRQIAVYVDFKSVSAQDASGPPALAGLVTDFNGLAAAWQALRAKFTFLNIPALTLPATPRVTVRKRVPASHLSVPSISLASASVSTSGSDSTWLVKFTNPPQGEDHDFSYTVRFSFPEFPDQDRVRTGTLRPDHYTVASLAVVPDTVLVGKSATLLWTARDSSGDVLTDSLLAGRRPSWESGQVHIATVNSTSGTVTGVAGGSASINATLETGHVATSVLVVPDISGTYTLKEENGVVVPGVTYADTIYSITTTGGSVTLRADGTFSYSRSATGTNLATNKTYDEGGAGSGTYTVNATGTALTFQVTAQEGVPLTFGGGSVNGTTLSLAVQTPEGNGSAVLQKSP